MHDVLEMQVSEGHQDLSREIRIRSIAIRTIPSSDSNTVAITAQNDPVGERLTQHAVAPAILIRPPTELCYCLMLWGVCVCVNGEQHAFEPLNDL